MKVSDKDQQGDSGLYAVGLKFTDELRWIFRPQPHRDLGIDAVVEVVEHGESKGELLALQIKSGISCFAERTSTGIVFRFDEEHHAYWRDYPIPVVIVIHSPKDNIAYWQVVNENTARSTGKGWKVELPLANVISKETSEAIHKFCDFAIPASSYSITEFKDVSHGAAKRYSARVLLNRDLSRGEIVQVVRKVTNDLRDREYYRSKLTRDHWVGRKANVVWLFLFPSLEDDRNNNCLCRSQWIDPLLDEQFHPARMDGMDIGEDLVIDWSENYRDFAKLHNDSTLSKEEYLRRVDEVLGRISERAEEAIGLLRQHERNEIAEADYLASMTRLQAVISELYLRGSEIGGAPLECSDFGDKFQCLITLADNIVLPFSERGLGTWKGDNRKFLIREAIKNYLEIRAELQYEYKKLH